MVLRSRGILPIVLDGGDPGRAVTEFLRGLLKAAKDAKRRSRRV